jgi:hypothetical protein
MPSDDLLTEHVTEGRLLSFDIAEGKRTVAMLFSGVDDASSAPDDASTGSLEAVMKQSSRQKARSVNEVRSEELRSSRHEELA